MIVLRRRVRGAQHPGPMPIGLAPVPCVCMFGSSHKERPMTRSTWCATVFLCAISVLTGPAPAHPK